MADASGSRPDVGYTFGYYRELSPGLIDFALVLAGVEPPARAGMRYLELGFGQGLSANIHAAACPGEYWGEDFNPAHAANAAEWAKASGAKARFTGESFAELAAREDLPEFDYIVLHGVWSWVPPAAHETILDIIRRRLKPGGAVYVSYNAQPGWTEILPLRQMMALAAGTDTASPEAVPEAIDRAFAFAEQLHAAGAAFFAAVPGAKRRLDAIARLSRSHLAHDHFNPTWTPMYFTEVQAPMAQAGLAYATTASLLDQLDELNLTPEQIQMLAGLPDPLQRESVRDFLVYQTFRRDLYVRDARALAPQDRGERLARQRVALTVEAAAVAYDVTGEGEEVALTEDLYAPIIAALAAGDGGPKTIAELFGDPEVARLPPGLVLDAIAVLIGSGRAHPAQSEVAVQAARAPCLRLNAHLARRARTSGEVRYLASPVIGAGVKVPRLEQLFLAARADGADGPDAWAAEVDAVFATQGLAVVKDGRTLETEAETRAELARLARAFEADRLPLLRRLGVAD
ncbi:MAG: class I SAM-dependent methyltransferase [Caulobacteraceae bacterium]|nr:class I SAM-dependent methyltransferase [Caulobacteraceae bacterium]